MKEDYAGPKSIKRNHSWEIFICMGWGYTSMIWQF